MKAFCSRILKALAPPLLQEVESASTLRADAEPFTPRRSSRFSASSSARATGKASRKASAAESALLKALGINVEDLAAKAEVIQEFKDFFDSPLRERHVHVLAAIFGKTMPSRNEILDMGSTEVCVSA
jgi:hypothetical protein